MSKNQVEKVIDKINKNLIGGEELMLVEKILKSGFLSCPLYAISNNPCKVHSLNNFLGWKRKFSKR